jgi:nicotinate phosphoribosyltransferase
VRELRSQADVRSVDVTGPRLHAATHEEVLAGATTDVYFLKTLDLLRRLGRADTPVVAEVFAQRAGVLCGTEEVRELLRGRRVRLFALPEGETFEAREVVLRIVGPYAAFGVFETALLGMLASASGWATAAREVSRRPERAAVVGGMDAASNVLAARLLGRAPVGTMPHAAVLIVGDTVEAARAYDAVVPEGEQRTVLVDTLQDEALEALRVANALGERLGAIRVDTPAERGGVTPELVRELRARLDLAGHSGVHIFVSGRITPERIPALAAAGADGFGVGSYVSAAPPIEMTLDLKEVDGVPVAKRGRVPGKTPNPRLEEVPL